MTQAGVFDIWRIRSEINRSCMARLRNVTGLKDALGLFEWPMAFRGAGKQAGPAVMRRGAPDQMVAVAIKLLAGKGAANRRRPAMLGS